LGAAGLEHISLHYNSEKQSKSESLKKHCGGNCPKESRPQKTTELEISKSRNHWPEIRHRHKADSGLWKEKSAGLKNPGSIDRCPGRIEKD